MVAILVMVSSTGSGNGSDTSNGSGTTSGMANGSYTGYGRGNCSIISLLPVSGVEVCRERVRRLGPQLLSVPSPSHFHPSLL